MIDWAFRGAVLAIAALAVFAVTLFELALLRGRARRRRSEDDSRSHPAIQDSLIAWLCGSDDLTRLRELEKTAPRELTRAIIGYRNAAGGSARDRLCDLTLQLGVLDGWREQTRSRDRALRREAFTALAFVSAYEPCRRVTATILAEALAHPEREIRVIAAQALALYGDAAQVAHVFHLATSETPLGRILLAEALKPHAVTLSHSALAEALDSGDARRILGALEIVVAWERALALAGMEAHVAHSDRLVRLAALRAAPLVIPTPELDLAVTRSLIDTDIEVAMAAVAAVARMRIEQALPLVARCLKNGDAPLARTAAAALASLPPRGYQVLQELANGPEPIAQAAAKEALGRMQTMGAG
jgi:HEAT repeat protein